MWAKFRQRCGRLWRSFLSIIPLSLFSKVAAVIYIFAKLTNFPSLAKKLKLHKLFSLSNLLNGIFSLIKNSPKFLWRGLKSLPRFIKNLRPRTIWRAIRTLRQIWLFALLGLVLVIVSGAVVFGVLLRKPPAPAFKLTGQLTLRLPETLNAGDPLTVEVSAPTAPENLPVTLSLLGSYGLRVYQAKFFGGLAKFNLDGSQTRIAGVTNLTATSGEALGRATLTVRSGPPVEPLVPLVGARSIPANGQDWSMAVVIPFDQWGNPVADNTVVDLNVRRPDTSQEKIGLVTKNLLAWTRLYAKTQAGRTYIAATSGDQHGPETMLLETAGWPTTYTLEATPPSLPADGRQFMTVRTSVLRDEYANKLPDGTLVTFVVTDAANQRRFIAAYTLDGVGQIALQAPVTPGTLKLKATVYTAESRELEVTFTAGPAVGNFPLKVQKNATDQTITFIGGPLLGDLGQYVPDGTEVLFRVIGKNGQAEIFKGIVNEGYVKLQVRRVQLKPDDYRLEATAGSGQGTTTFSLP